MNIYCKNRINIRSKETELLLDPELITTNSQSVFISHAHYDHLPKSRKRPLKLPPVVCSKATAALFYERIGYHLTTQCDKWENEDLLIESFPGGHTYDSTVAKITVKENNQTILYTGDINSEDRGYLKGFQPIKCNILILEATYGDKNYNFPSFFNQIEQARNYIQIELDKGHPVVLLGYPLGKAQLLNHSFGDLTEKRYSTNSIWKMEQIHRELGLELYSTKNFTTEVMTRLQAINEPWLLFHNHSSISDSILSSLKNKFNVRIVGFSGWARNKEQYINQMGCDEAFMISDHADYNNLLKIIKQCEPEKIFTVYGQANDLAKDLQKEGFNAIPLKKGQATLESFF